MVDVKQTKVLVVDDHFLARQVVADVMRELGVTNVVMAVDGLAGRDALKEALVVRPFDVVFLDRNLPHLDGIEILKLFSKRPECAKTAFIMLTSLSDQSEVLQAVQAGAIGYLIKPVAKQSIGKKFNEALLWIGKQSTKLAAKA